METFHRNQFVKRITIISAVDPSPLRVYTANLELCRRLDRWWTETQIRTAVWRRGWSIVMCRVATGREQLCAISFQRSRLCKFRANYKHRLFRALRGAPRRIWLGSGKSEERNAFDLVDDESQIRRWELLLLELWNWSIIIWGIYKNCLSKKAW